MTDRVKAGCLLAVIIAWMAVAAGAQQPATVVAPDQPPQIGSTTSGATPTTTPAQVQTNQQAVPTTEVPSPAEPNHAPEQIKWALGASLFLQWLKKTKYFPAFSEQTSGTLQAWWAFVLAVSTAIGINVVIHGSIWDTNGLDVSFTHITFAAVKDVAFQWISQQGWYLFIVKQSMNSANA